MAARTRGVACAPSRAQCWLQDRKEVFGGLGVLFLLFCLGAGAQAAGSTLSGAGLLAEVEMQHLHLLDERHIVPRHTVSSAAIDGSATDLPSLRSLTGPGDVGTPFHDPPDVAVPHITLRTNDGQYFGGSLAAVGELLVLGWGDRVLASPDAADGGMFYLSFDGMWADAPENEGNVVRVFASEVRSSSLSRLNADMVVHWCLVAG